MSTRSYQKGMTMENIIFDNKKMLMTLVQHSGFGYAGRKEMEHFVEMRTITNKRDFEKVKKVGGFLTSTFSDIEEAEVIFGFEKKGHFSTSKIDGLRILITKGE